MPEVWFVTGGARSGKSSYGEHLAANLSAPVTYVATLEPLDDEMRARIARHRGQRPSTWRTVESPRAPVEAARAAPAGDTILLDCLSVWVSNRLLDLGTEAPTPTAIDALEGTLTEETRVLLDVLTARTGTSIVVSNEVGAGLVPEYALGRAYRDLLGRVNQQVAQRAARAWLLVAGRALELPPLEQ